MSARVEYFLGEMATTPQVYSTVWNGQGKLATGDQQNTAWDPNAPKPAPLPRDKEKDEIAKDQANAGKTPIETEVDKIKQHNDVAANTLCQKNRKRKQSSIELPFDPTVEEGQTVTLTGFATNFDGKWLVTEVQYSFSGKSGSRFSIELMQCLDTPVKTPGASSGAVAGASTGATGVVKGPIKVPAQPSKLPDLVKATPINSDVPAPANVPNLTLIPNETAPTWLNNFGSLNKSQQDLNTDNTGPTG